MPAEIGTTPKAILMVSGHWEEPDFAVMSAAKPGMIYDYGGFPPETYRIIYPAPGAPDLAVRGGEVRFEGEDLMSLSETEMRARRQREAK